MSLDEKIGQMTQAERGALQDINDIKTYYLGSLLSGGGSAPSTNSPQAWADMYDYFQYFALQTRLKIPLIYGIDAVHDTIMFMVHPSFLIISDSAVQEIHN